MRKSWEWFQSRATSTHAQVWLFVLSFSESSFFIIPPDILLIAMLSARTGRWVYLATLTTVASLLGAVAGYLLGAFVFEPIVQPLISFYHLTEEFVQVGALYERSTFWVVLAAAFTPIPYKVFVLSAGFFTVPFTPFILASLLGRGARFFLISWLANRYGHTAAEIFIRNFKHVTIVISIIVAVLVAVHFAFPELLF